MEHIIRAVKRLTQTSIFIALVAFSGAAWAGDLGLTGPTSSIGGTYTLSWDDFNSGVCTDHYVLTEGFNTEFQGCAFSFDVVDKSPGTYSYELSLCIYLGELGFYICIEDGGHTVEVLPDTQPVLNFFQLENPYFDQNESVMLQWTSSNADYCTPDGIVPFPANGPLELPPYSTSVGLQSAILWCVGSNGDTSSSITINFEVFPPDPIHDLPYSEAYGFDDNYKIDIADLNSDQLWDIVIRWEYQPNMLQGVKDFALIQVNEFEFEAQDLNLFNVGATIPSNANYFASDVNADGVFDLGITNLPTSYFPNAMDLVIYAPSTPNNLPTGITVMDNEVVQFFTEMTNWMNDKDYFDDNAGYTSTGQTVFTDIAYLGFFSFSQYQQLSTALFSCYLGGWDLYSLPLGISSDIAIDPGGIAYLVNGVFSESTATGNHLFCYNEAEVFSVDYSAFNQQALMIADILEAFAGTEIIGGSSEAIAISQMISDVLGNISIMGDSLLLPGLNPPGTMPLSQSLSWNGENIDWLISKLKKFRGWLIIFDVLTDFDEAGDPPQPKYIFDTNVLLKRTRFEDAMESIFGLSGFGDPWITDKVFEEMVRADSTGGTSGNAHLVHEAWTLPVTADVWDLKLAQEIEQWWQSLYGNIPSVINSSSRAGDITIGLTSGIKNWPLRTNDRRFDKVQKQVFGLSASQLIQD